MVYLWIRRLSTNIRSKVIDISRFATMSDHMNVPSDFTDNVTISPPLDQKLEENSPISKDNSNSAKTIPSNQSTANATYASSNANSPASESLLRSKTNSTTSTTSSSNSINLPRTNRSKSINQQHVDSIPRGRQHIKIPNMNTHNARSPLRSSNSTRLSTSRTPQNSLYPQSQRRGSIASIGDTSDFSTNLGMPYTLNMNGSSSTLNNVPTTATSAAAVNRIPPPPGPLSTASSPRNSFSSTFNSASIGDGSFSQRRYSDNSATSRKPSTEEVFDLMEREQDAIVLKLMREIQQLKEDNRALRQTINQLTSPISASHSRSQSRSSLDSSRRRNSSLYTDDELISVSSSISNTPRSTHTNLAVPVTSSRKPSMNLSSAINSNQNDNINHNHHNKSNSNPENFDSFRSNSSTINMNE